MRAAVPRHPEGRSATTPEGWAINTGTQSATPTASPVPRSAAMWPSASPPRSQPSQPPVCTITRVPCTCRIETSRRAVGESSRCTALHLPITSFTGSVPPSPNDPASRVVVKARIPHCSKSVTTSLGTSASSVSTVVNAGDGSAECVEAFIDALIAALDLADVVDEAGSLGAQCGEQHRHTGADIGRFEEGATQTCRAVDEGAVGIAQHDAGSHRRELIDEEHPRLEHLLVHHDQAFALCRSDDRDRHCISRECRPRLILELRDVPAHVALDLARLLRRHDQVGTLDFTLDAQSLESHAR